MDLPLEGPADPPECPFIAEYGYHHKIQEDEKNESVSQDRLRVGQRGIVGGASICSVGIEIYVT